MYLHQTPATGNVSALLKIGKCYACTCTDPDTVRSATRYRLRIKLFFFCSSPHAGMKQAHRTRCSEKASVHNNTAERPSHQRKRWHYHPVIFTQCVFQKKRCTPTWRAQANEQWACLLKRQYTPGGIPSTSYHSHLKLNLI